nr:immunity 63 family protein [Bacillus pumilus]
MSPYIQIDQHGYSLIQYERGIEVLHKRTRDADQVIYWILEDTMFLSVDLDRMKQYQVGNIHTHLPKDPSIHKKIVERVNESFRVIGEKSIYRNTDEKVKVYNCTKLYLKKANCPKEKFAIIK